MSKLRLSQIVACVILLIGILPLPIGFYAFLRIVVTGVAIYNALHFNDKNNTMFVVFVLLAILFNPLMPVYLNKELWSFIDLVGAVFFGLLAYKSKD